MNRHRHQTTPHSLRLPAGPLLGIYQAAGVTHGQGRREAAIQDARSVWLNPEFLDRGDDPSLCQQLRSFYLAVSPVSFHPAAIERRPRFLRHALNHLIRGQDPLPDRVSRCLEAGEAYSVPGLGPTFWAGVVQALDPDRLPCWCPATEAGLVRLGLVSPPKGSIAQRFGAVASGYDILRTLAPNLSALAIDDFLARVGRIDGRELPTDPLPVAIFAWGPDAERIRDAVRKVRVSVPLRQRIREAPDEVRAGNLQFQIAARCGNHEAAFETFRATFPDSQWELALAHVDDAYTPALPISARTHLWAEVAGVLRDEFRIHPLELADVLIELAGFPPESPSREPTFGGFCTDTFQFLNELATTNTREWMNARRERYRFVLREPVVELCKGLEARYVRPVLGGEYGWNLEAEAKPGRALTSICKNDFGRSGPYQTVQWITFYRQSQANRRADAQFFVRVAAEGVRYGFHLGRSAREAGKQFRRNVQDHAEAIHAALAIGAVFEECQFLTGDDLGGVVSVRSPADLRHWATAKTIAIAKHLPPDAFLLRRDDLVGEILLTFDRLVPVFACTAEPDPRTILARRAGVPVSRGPYDRAAFARDTFLPETWLDRVLGLLRMKRQLVLQGVPGTGKTHVARCLARWLTHDRADCVRLVQFHPAYSYEEFVEGIRVRNVEVNGRNEVNYPVEDGVLCGFAEQAIRRPSEPHVLLIDELNRGNLPRIFGELLYLLEYRDQAVTLPYSRREFRLPDNLFVVATMNASDRSAVALDQALRRRFSFVDMAPEPALLAAWLDHHPPADPDETFGPRVVRVFEELNTRLTRDLGPDRQIGHSFFMIPDLDTDKLTRVWEHHIRPLLLDALGGRRERLADYDPARLLGGSNRRTRSRGETIGGG